MDINEIAKVLVEIGDLLELTEDSPYKARAFYHGAQALTENSGYNLDDPKSLLEIPGVGESLAKIIWELKTTGRAIYLAELRERVSPQFRKLLHIPGLGPKTIRLILKETKAKNLAELEKALDNREIRKIKGLSSKTEAKLKRGLEMFEDVPGLFILGTALPLGREMVSYLKKLPGVTAADVVGSTSRGREMVRDLDLIVGCENPSEVAKAFSAHPKLEKIVKQEDDFLRGITWYGLPVDLYLVPAEAYTNLLEHLKGDVGHHAKLREMALKQGLNWDIVPAGAYGKLGLGQIPPELREGTAELEIPPNLLQLTDMRGDLHMHTRWSDGGYTIGEMAEAAANKGYEYIAICDHSKNLSIAKGLQPQEVLKQAEEIEQVNRDMKKRIKVLRGAETDILKDGSLDYPDEILGQLDVVVASVHLRYKLNLEEMTKRVETALKNPHMDILAHPTGRLLGRRDPYELHLEKVFDIAAKNKKALEINASPSRLDLKDKYSAMAKKWSIPIAINTDAHSIEELEDMEYGVITARRAGLETEDVLNTYSLDKLEDWLRKR